MRTSALRRYLLALAGLLLSLGFAALASWQYGRAEQKAQWLQRVEAARLAPPRPLAQALAEPPEAGLAVGVQGEVELLQTPALLLDNQQREGRVGVREFALVRPLGSAGAWLLADFGWLPMPPDRSLPSLPDLPETLQAAGLLTGLPGQGLRLGRNPDLAPGAPYLLLGYLDNVELGEALGVEVVPNLLRLDPQLPIGHARDLDVLPNTLPPEKHRGYALQWSGLALAALLITLLLFFRSRA